MPAVTCGATVGRCIRRGPHPERARQSAAHLEGCATPPVSAVPAARRDGTRIGVAHLGIFVIARNAHVGGEIIGADQHHVDAFDRCYFVGAVHSFRAFELHDHHRGIVERLVSLRRRRIAILEMRQRGREAAFSERRIFRGAHDLARLARRAHVRHDHAQRAAVEHTADDVELRHAGERRDPGIQRGKAYLAGRLQRQAGMLKVDIERVEARGLGETRDLTAAREAHRHGGRDFAAREPLLDAVAHEPLCHCYSAGSNE
jgi:hypothetical protein